MRTVRRAAEDGYTLVELLLSLTITALLVASIYGCFFSGMRSWQKGAARMDHQQNGRIAMDRIIRELRYAGQVEVLENGAGIRYRGAGGKSYQLGRAGPAGEELVLIHRPEGGAPTETKIALEITALSFTVDEGNRVTVSLTAGAGPESMTVRSSVRPRNIP